MSAAAGSGLTADFWQAATEGRLVRPVCDVCERSFFTPSWSCPHCGSESWTYRQSCGRGTVYSFTVVQRPPDPSWAAPYVLAVIDLDEGWHMLSRIELDPEGIAAADETPDRLMAQRVEVVFRPEGRPPHRMLPVFVPRPIVAGDSADRSHV